MSYVLNGSANIRPTLRNALIWFKTRVAIDGKPICIYKWLVDYPTYQKGGVLELTSASIWLLIIFVLTLNNRMVFTHMSKLFEVKTIKGEWVSHSESLFS